MFKKTDVTEQKELDKQVVQDKSNNEAINEDETQVEPQLDQENDFFSDEVNRMKNASNVTFEISVNTRYDIEPGVAYQDVNELVEYDTYNQNSMDIEFIYEIISNLRKATFQERIEAIWGVVGPHEGYAITGHYDEKRILIYSADYQKVLFSVDEGVTDVYVYDGGYEEWFFGLIEKYKNKNANI